MYPGHRAIRLDKNHIQRYQRVFHPKSDLLRSLKEKQHSMGRRHMFAKHQPLGSFARVVRDLDRKGCLAPVTANTDAIRMAVRGLGPMGAQSGGKKRAKSYHTLAQG
ncbi:hypothetical protein ALP8811_01168 [Aliiroseovarius pelagivivens]|uniref:Uncharacterized protein n=1 Tax=Aliiroseovarius pelagivivens TaxID=1639690 RepID=A0A2R8AJF4_9RHOB|nr:hypothetical protein ALP8811_01168 [Aliiroseovarius pelagivivens]